MASEDHPLIAQMRREKSIAPDADYLAEAVPHFMRMGPEARERELARYDGAERETQTGLRGQAQVSLTAMRLRKLHEDMKQMSQ